MTQVVAAGARGKAAGLNRIARTAPTFLSLVRLEAKRLSAKHGRVTADDVRDYAESVGLRPSNRNVWGAVFAEPGWTQVDTIASRRPSNHGHRNPVWHWTGPAP